MEFEFEIVPSIEKQIVTSSNLNSYTLKHPCINSGTTEAPVYMITVCTLAKDGAVDKQFTIGQAVADGVCTYTANTRTLTFNDGDLVAGDYLYVQYEYIWRKGMNFEEALKAMREGKEITRPALISDDDTIVMGMDVTGENHLLRNRLYLYHTSDSAKLKRNAIMDSDSVLADDWKIYEETERKNVMNFEEALKALLEGKKIRCIDWFPETYFYFDEKNMVVRDNNDDTQAYGFYNMYKDRKWEFYEEKPKPDIIIEAKGCFLPTAEIKSVTISGNEIKGIKQIIPGFDNKTIGLYFDTDRLEIKWENPDESEISPITRLAREMAKFANIKE